MNENINLIEKLKNVPKGTKLWSPICGECEFMGIDTSSTNIYSIKCVSKNYRGILTYIMFTANGKYCNYFVNGECVLFPSKENHDWSKFEIPKKHKEFKPFQKVLIPGIIDNVCYWFATLYSHYDSKHKLHVLIDNRTVFEDNEIVPYEGNEDKLGTKYNIK